MRITPEELAELGSRRRGDAVRTSPAGKGPGGGAGRRKTPKERDIQRAILAFLGTVPGVVAWKTGGGMFRMEHKGKARMVRIGKVGVADIVGWLQYRLFVVGVGELPSIAKFLAIEVKAAKGYLSVEQRAFLESVTAAGGLAICARSVSDVATALGVGAAGEHAERRPGRDASAAPDTEGRQA